MLALSLSQGQVQTVPESLATAEWVTSTRSRLFATVTEHLVRTKFLINVTFYSSRELKKIKMFLKIFQKKYFSQWGEAMKFL